MKKTNNLGILLLGAFVVLDALVWWRIAFPQRLDSPELYFFDVGQGDSELILLPGGVTVLTDAGPTGWAALRGIEVALPSSRRYLDLVVISHPQLDHFGGLAEIVKRYEIGTVLTSGRQDAEAKDAWSSLTELLREKGIPFVTVGAGDGVSYGENRIAFLSPDRFWRESAESNDAALVSLLTTPSLRAFFASDINEALESYLTERFDLRADVLKVPHHGSKFSSSGVFLKEVAPKVAVVSAGRDNRYGHPSKEALARFAAAGAQVFRTDEDGTVRIRFRDGKLQVFTSQ